MTPRQRRIIGLLVAINVALLATLLVVAKGCLLLPGLSSSMLPWELPSPVPTSSSERYFSSVCQGRAVRLLSEARLGGTVTLADQTVRFDLVYRVKHDEYAEHVGQQVWTAFDTALALLSAQCDTFSRVEIVIEAQGAPNPTRVYAAVDSGDLQAFSGGKISERLFIDRVQYRIEPIDGS